MKHVIIYCLFLAILLPSVSKAQGSADSSVLYIHAELYTGDGGYFADGMLGIRGDKIILAGFYDPKVDISGFQKVVDVKGKIIYPGFIVPNSTVGLREIDAVRATLDYEETGTLNPNVRSQIAYNSESVIIPTLRTNGVLMAQVAPRGGLISGTSSVMQLDGMNWEESTYLADDGVHVNWPSMFNRKGWWAEPGGIEPNKEREKQLKQLNDFFIRARSYSGIENPQETDLRLEAMQRVFTGEAALYIHASFTKELIEIAGFVKRLEIPRTVIVGGLDAWRVPELLKENNIAVIIGRLHDLPGRQDDPVDMPFRLPYLLQQAGVLYCLSYEGDMEVMGARNLPFTAGTAIAYGLTRQQAVQAITGNTAKILGIAGTTGTLEKGKDATFFISSGDALDMRTNKVEIAYIRGVRVDLNNHQTDLYNRFRERHRQLH